MSCSFESVLLESWPFMIAMHDNGFAKRFAAVLQQNGCVCSLDGSEHWVGNFDGIARLVIRLRRRGEAFDGFSEDPGSADAYVEEDVVLKALEMLGWRITSDDEMACWDDVGARLQPEATPEWKRA